MAKLLIVLCLGLCVFGPVLCQETQEPQPETTLAPPPETTTTTPAPPPETTTPAPDTTTTPAPDTTTTPAPTTPPPPPETTTTPAPDTTIPPSPETTTPPAPTTPAPETSYNYNVTEKNITCVMLEGAINFVVNYSIGNNATKEITVTLPKHPKADFKVEGTCNGSDSSQWIEVTWGAVNETSSFMMEFSGKDGSWSMKSFTASLYLDADVFVNATDVGKTLDLVMQYDFAPISVAYNHSFSCHSSMSTNNVTGTIEGTTYELPLASNMDDIHIQAYNEIPNEPDFVTSIHCAADHTSDVVPIAVGCALAALVVIVLIAYLVGRRRRSAAYQSV